MTHACRTVSIFAVPCRAVQVLDEKGGGRQVGQRGDQTQRVKPPRGFLQEARGSAHGGWMGGWWAADEEGMRVDVVEFLDSIYHAWTDVVGRRRRNALRSV